MGFINQLTPLGGPTLYVLKSCNPEPTVVTRSDFRPYAGGCWKYQLAKNNNLAIKHGTLWLFNIAMVEPWPIEIDG